MKKAERSPLGAYCLQISEARYLSRTRSAWLTPLRSISGRGVTNSARGNLSVCLSP